MKCKYCGSNLGIEDAVCPYCGKENEQAAGYQTEKKEYSDEYEAVKKDVKEKSKLAGRIGRLIVISVMLVIIFLMSIFIISNSNVERRIKREEFEISREVAKNRSEITATLKNMEKNREYLAMDNYQLNYSLRANSDFDDYSRVFTAVINYGVIHDDILSIIDGYDYYGERTNKDWCYDAAIYISDWNKYVGGAFWGDSEDSPMHSGEHGEFLLNIKKETQDMVQVYFKLTDEEASSMWEMSEEELGELLYSKCKDIYPEENLDE